MKINLYKIQFNIKADANYVCAKTIIDAVEIWKEKLQSKKDPEVVEWIADYIYFKKNSYE